MKNIFQNKKVVYEVVAIMVIFIVGFYFYHKHKEQSIFPEYVYVEQKDYIEYEDSIKLLNVISTANSQMVATESQPVDCLSFFVKNKDNQKLKEKCPFVFAGMDDNEINDTNLADVQKFLRLIIIESNTWFFESFLANNKDKRDGELSKLYEELIIVNYVKNKKNELGTHESVQNLQGFILDGGRGFVGVNILNLSTSTDFAHVSDFYDSGSYNIFDTIYKIDFIDNIFSFSLAKILDTTKDGFTELKQNQVIDEGINSIVNSYFDKEDKSLHIIGFLPFGLYPCSLNSKYDLFGDRFILVSQSEKKECIGREDYFSSPESAVLEKDFDRTPVVTYQISSNVLEEAKKYIFK